MALGPLPTPTRRLLWAAEGSSTLPQQLAERLAFERDDDEALARAVLDRLRARKELLGQVSQILSRCMGLDAQRPAVEVADVMRDEEAASMVGGLPWAAAVCAWVLLCLVPAPQAGLRAC